MDMAGSSAESRFAIDRALLGGLGLNKIKSGRPWAAFCLAQEVATVSLLVAVALSQQVLRQVGERGPRQGGERQRARHIDGGDPEPRGQ